jgi:hypothetical protein
VNDISRTPVASLHISSTERPSPRVHHSIEEIAEAREEDEAAEMMAALMIFSTPLTQLGFKQLFSSLIKLIADATVIFSSIIGNTFVSTTALICLNIVGRPLYQASYGILLSAQLILFYTPVYCMNDKI